MERYDDRPISVYDNLNTPPTTATTAIHTNTPKTQTSLLPTTTTATVPVSAALATTNGATRSPIYSDISFKFNDNIRPHHQQQHQQQRQQQSQLQMHLLPNDNQSSNQNQQQLQQKQASSQVHPNYASPFKTAAMNTNKSTTPIPVTTPQAQQIQSTPTAIITATNAKTNTAQRPLSQHSQSELNEASQSIAAVKAALSDAKSKFFGLNGFAQDSSNSNNSNQYESQVPSETKVQISPARTTSKPIPPPKPQPKYQNIPENSAIFRKQPPELPPKPTSSPPLMVRRESSPALTSTPQPANSVAEPQMPLTMNPRSSSPSEMPVTAEAVISSSPTPLVNQQQQQQQANILPYSAYKQIPLNDIDIVQPSQAVYMSTTVPQNIKGSKIAGRHTPTRNSLRHSRMLVVNNKNYQAIQHPNPMNFKYPNLARWLLILEIIIGLLISFLAIWIFCLAPNTAIQSNPYWSGLALLFAGILGLVLVRYQRIKRHKVRENCFIFLRADSYLLSLIAVLLCSIALICAAIHFARLTASDTKCESTNMLLEHGSCTCTFNSINSMASTTTNKTLEDHSNGLLVEEEVPDAGFEDRSYKVEYRDLSCKEVNGAWIFILELTIAFNAIGFLVAVLYIVLLACYRHNSKRFYSSVHTSTF